MPEAVQKYIDTKDYREVDKIQRSLLQGYLYDIAHYATAEEKVKAEKCYYKRRTGPVARSSSLLQ